MADHPLKPATDRRLGKPLPYQLANQTQAFLQAKIFRFTLIKAHRALAIISVCYSLPKGKFSRVTHPSATKDFKSFVQLACVKHTASVHPEPGSNSLKYPECSFKKSMS